MIIGLWVPQLSLAHETLICVHHGGHTYRHGLHETPEVKPPVATSHFVVAHLSIEVFMAHKAMPKVSVIAITRWLNILN